jgi:hypothetical protein
MAIRPNQNLFELLRTREILAILDGDATFEEFKLKDGSSMNIALPYLNGPDLCDLSTRFGLPVTYSWGGGTLSRWQYLDELIEHCIERNKCSDLLTYIFSKRQFNNMLAGHTPEVIEDAYKQIVEGVMRHINGCLYFGGNELVLIDDRFVMRKIGATITISTPKIRTIDREYIISISKRAMEDVESKNFDSAITKSRTLLEEVFCYAIEKKGEAPSTSGNIADLYKQVKNHYNMHADANTDRRINTLLSGLEKIISSISEMRNKDSDAHGVGAARINIDEHHARLFVNAAMSMADFILSVEKKANHTV